MSYWLIVNFYVFCSANKGSWKFRENRRNFENIRIENARKVEMPPFQTAGPISMIVFFILSSLDLPAVDTNEWAMCAE